MDTPVAGVKIPVSVLVVMHTPDLQVLLIERARNPGFWQSVTGSLDAVDEDPLQAALREVEEETGVRADASDLRDWRLANVYEIYPQWRHRYPPGVWRNTERVFSLQLAQACEVRLAPREHRAQRWLPWQQAADACFSASNADAIRQLPQRLRGLPPCQAR